MPDKNQSTSRDIGSPVVMNIGSRPLSGDFRPRPVTEPPAPKASGATASAKSSPPGGKASSRAKQAPAASAAAEKEPPSQAKGDDLDF